MHYSWRCFNLVCLVKTAKYRSRCDHRASDPERLYYIHHRHHRANGSHMAIDLTDAVVYDEEIFPNCFTLTAESLNSPDFRTWQVSEYVDQRRDLLAWCEYVRSRQIPMIGFFSLSFDYPLLHYFISNPNATPYQLYQKAVEIMAATN